MARVKMWFILFVFPLTGIGKPLEIRVEVDFTYEDLVRRCDPVAHLYLLGESEGLSLKRARLTTWIRKTTPFPYSIPQKPIFDPFLDWHKQYCNVVSLPNFETTLLKEELNGMGLYEDKKGTVWLKKLTLNPRLLNWILWHAKTRDSWCVPSQPLKTIGPVPHVFEFDTEGLGEIYFKSFARKQRFQGHLSNSRIYEVTLGLMQENISDFIRSFGSHIEGKFVGLEDYELRTTDF